MTALPAALIALLLLLPTGSAWAKSTTQTASPQVGTPGVQAALVEVPTGNLTSILAGLPVADLGLSNAELGGLLGGLDEGVLGGQTGALTTLVGLLLSGDPTATLSELTEAVQGDPVLGLLLALAGESVTPEDVLAGLSPEEVTTLLGHFTEGADAGEIEQILAGLGEGGVGGGELVALQTILGALTDGLSEEAVAELREDLGSLPTGLNAEELAALTPAELTEAIAALFGTASPTQLAPVVADLLGGLTWGAGTTGSLAEVLGVPVETLAGALGESAEGGFSDLPTVTSEVGDTGKVVGLVNRASGLALGLLDPEGPGEEEGEGENEGEGGGSGGEGGSGSGGSGSGGSGSGGNGGGGSGGAGANGLPGGGVTLTITLPPAATPAAATAHPKAPAKIKVLSHRVRGRVAKVVLQAPSAGTLELSGPGVRTKTTKLRHGGKVTLTAILAKARMTALKQGGHHLRVRLKATFKPSSGASSTTTALVTFA